MLRPWQLETLKVIQVKYPMATKEELPQRFLGSDSRVLNFAFALYLKLFFWAYAMVVHICIEIPVALIYVPRIIFLKFVHGVDQFEVDGLDINGQPKKFLHRPMVFLELKVIEIRRKVFPFMVQKKGLR